MPEAEAVEILSTPWNDVPMLSKPGIWERNVAIWPFPGIVNVPLKPAGSPVSVVASRLTVIGSDERFAMAMPVWMVAETLSRPA